MQVVFYSYKIWRLLKITGLFGSSDFAMAKECMTDLQSPWLQSSNGVIFNFSMEE